VPGVVNEAEGPYSIIYEPVHDVQVKDIDAPEVVMLPAARPLGAEQLGGDQVKIRPLTGRTVDETVHVLAMVLAAAVVAAQLVAVVLP
jgi:hypothetical protein